MWRRKYLGALKKVGTALLVGVLCAQPAGAAAPKNHVITFGKWSNAAWLAGTGTDAGKPQTIKVRTLIVDGRIKEYVLGLPHDVTDRSFVVRRAFRVNDSLPDEPAVRWQWQRGGWLLVDRVTGHVASVNLPEFDALYSTAIWYRDYAAYCGVSEDGKKIFAVVVQLNRRKPVLKKELSGDSLPDNAAPDSACPAPVWSRGPVRVNFEKPGGAKETFAIRGHVVDQVNDQVNDEEEEAEEGSR
jgi:hypothetical protein